MDEDADREQKREETERAMWEAVEALRLHQKPNPLQPHIPQGNAPADKRRENVTQEATTRADKVNQWQRAEPTRDK